MEKRKPQICPINDFFFKKNYLSMSVDNKLCLSSFWGFSSIFFDYF